MFYIDGISLHKIKEELKQDLAAKKINKITKNTELSLSVHFGKSELIFSCNPTFPICYITSAKEEVLELSSGLTDTLRKYLMNAELMDIDQMGYDRILVFIFKKLNELGEAKIYKIYFELMGKYSNFIFTDQDNKIIDLMKRFSIEENRLRSLFPGVDYEQPIIGTKKMSPFDLDEDAFDRCMKNNSLLSEVEGIGKILLDSITDYQSYERILNSRISPKLYFKNDKIILGTVLDISPKEYDRVSDYSTFYEAINYYIEYENMSHSFEIMGKKLMDIVDKKIKKDTKILNILEKEKQEKSDYEKYKEHADILAANIFNVKKGMDKIKAHDFYHDNEIEIPLDVRLYPQENLDKTYKKYNKLKRGIEANEMRRKEITADLDYYNSIKLFISNSRSVDNLKDIYEELISQKLIKQSDNIFGKKQVKIKKNTKIIGYGTLVYHDIKILYGRNNIENDNLTFKIADKDDIWLHSKNIPGAHVIIKTDDKTEITDDILNKAAEVAAYFTKSQTGEKVNVDYTQKKYINKPKGSKPGFVTYTNEKGLVVKKPKEI